MTFDEGYFIYVTILWLLLRVPPIKLRCLYRNRGTLTTLVQASHKLSVTARLPCFIRPLLYFELFSVNLLYGVRTVHCAHYWPSCAKNCPSA